MIRPLDPNLFCLTVLPLLLGTALIAYLTLGEAPAMARYAVVLPLAYLLGSIPWGYFFLTWVRGVDIREYGSGKTGMTNVLRTAGGRVAAAVLLLDLGKGVVVVLLAREILGTTSGEVTAGLLALAGHNWPVFLKFQGGRGIATGLGVLSVMAPIPAVIGAMVFIPITLISRYLSLGSIIGVVAAAVSLVALALLDIYSTTYTWYASIGGAIILWQHRDNIQRLLQGTERRLGHPATRIS
jgi:acyl phosphate:glycerol-3-phosphate acyltransferase